MTDADDRLQKEAKARSIARVLAFENDIRLALRGLKPEQFATYGAKLYRQARSDTRMLAQCPPHFLIHAIEANCAYYRQWYFQPFTHDRFAHAINLWHSFEDPYVRHVLTNAKSAFGFMQFLHRTQTMWQAEPYAAFLGRCEYLCSPNNGTDSIEIDFLRRYGLTPRRWSDILVTLFVGANRPHALGLRKPIEEGIKITGIPAEEANAVLKEIAVTPGQLGEHYMEARGLQPTGNRLSPLLWSQLRPPLAETPVLSLDDVFLVPVPQLILRLLDSDLFDRIKRSGTPAAQRELSMRFERYVADVITHHLAPEMSLKSDTLAAPKEKACDYAFVLDDALLCVECKCVSLTSKFVTDDAVLGTGSTTDIADGVVQLAATVKRLLKTGSSDGRTFERPAYGIVATLGRVPMANTDDYWRAIRDRLGRAGYDRDTTQSLFAAPPAILDAEGIELLCMYSKASGKALASIWAEKLASSPAIDGDWPEFLRNRLQLLRPQKFPFWKDLVDRLFRRLIPVGSGDVSI